MALQGKLKQIVLVIVSLMTLSACSITYGPAYVIAPKTHFPYPSENQDQRYLTSAIYLGDGYNGDENMGLGRASLIYATNQRWYRLSGGYQFFSGYYDVKDALAYNGMKNFAGLALVGEGLFTLPIGPLKIGAGLAPSLYFEGGSYQSFINKASADNTISVLSKTNFLVTNVLALVELRVSPETAVDIQAGVGFPGLFNTELGINTSRFYFYTDPLRLASGTPVFGAAMKF